MRANENTPFDESINDLPDLYEKVESGDYEKAARILEIEQSRQTEAGNHLLSEFLGVARHICLACHQSHADVDWHRRAQVMAGSREEEMKSQLQVLLEMMSATNLYHHPPDDRFGNSSDLHGNSDSGRHGLLKLIQSMISNLHHFGSVHQFGTIGPNISSYSVDKYRQILKPYSNAMERSSQVTEQNADLKVYCLGRFRVFAHDKLICNWPSLKGKSIFKYLIEHHKSAVSKEILMDRFWPDTDPDSARRNLHQAIYNIRQAFHQHQLKIRPIIFENDHYGINPEMKIWLDFEEFEWRLNRGRQLESVNQKALAINEYRAAEELYQGDFLEEDPFEEWPVGKREQLRIDYINIADRLSSWHQELKDYNPAIEYCRKILEKDDCFEAAHRRLMQCHQANGQPGLAVRQYHLCVEKLRNELEVSPSPETRSLYETITHANLGLGKAFKTTIV